MKYDFLKELKELEEKKIPFVLATVIKARGSTPQKPGSKMIVFHDGSIKGTIGGGCSEAEAKRRALRCFDEKAPMVVAVNLNDDIAKEEGMLCGGQMKVFLEPRVVFKT